MNKFSLHFFWAPEHLVSMINFLLTLIFVSFILRSKKPPGSTLAWLFFIAAIPYVGIPFYIFLSGRKFKTKFQKKEALFEPKNEEDNENADTVEKILGNLGVPPPRQNSEALVISSGKEAYSELTNLIESAQKSISLTTFIFANDGVGRSILELLISKAEQGVSVRILLDSLGSIWVRHPSFRKFKKMGGKIGYFMPLIHVPFRGRYNLRNHRKIIVVDSQKAVLGGMNIAEEYMGYASESQQWIDLGLKIVGPSAADLETVFAKDWKFATGEDFSKDPIPLSENHFENRLQIVASGPDVIGDPLYDFILSLIFKATRRIWIATPYFIPDESLAKALQLACQRGVDVHILVPKKSNHFLADLARGTYLRQLESSGCKISFFPKMMHAKAFLVDEEYALVGSANFDMRSLLYNFEIGAFMSSKPGINSVRDWFTHCFALSDEKLEPGSFWIDLAEGVGRVLGPLI